MLQWPGNYAYLSQQVPVEQRAYGHLLLSITTEIKALILKIDGKVVACALGVLQSALQGVFDQLTAIC